jgi:hypothetical protein
MIGEKAADVILKDAKTTTKHSIARPPSQGGVHA